MANNKIGFMTTEEFKTNIQDALQAFAKGNLTKNSLELFSKLGYVTERRAPLDKPTFDEFQDTYISDQRFDETKARVKEWKYVDLLFQLSREEVSQQASLFDTKQVDKTIIETYLFFALELTGDDYNRTDLSNITREINRLFPMPVMVLFKYGNKLTFSIINRRLHKRDESKDVLEKVTLIKDISIESPLRAHIEILFDLSFQELLNKHQFTNFVELHNAWQKTLDTKELNKRFYSELFNWYLWAVQSVRFPNDVNDDKDDNVYNAESVIRLLTRLIFVWFIKEKNLVPETLFNVKKLKTILKDLKPESEKTSVYYRAILQNLFFATLNTPMDKDITDENKDEKRRFINTLPKTGNDQYLDQTKYRYQDYFINPDKALELFATIPYLNGGLFECLDFKEGNKEIRFDGFSSTEKRQAFVPDKLFFANEFVLDLNAEYGTKGKKYKVEGLINILDSYKFTIAENTPLEEEIALDPELLGKVFENLLASYNPETQTTARKQTGSFYTPREIVNYMVDESLIAYFKQKLDNSDNVEIRLRDLFAHTTDLPEFSKTENIALIKAISETKILDPACGSGAFPMGVLHRLVDLLNKLDPENKKWNELQIQRAIDETAEVYKLEKDSEERKIRFNEIEKAFDLSMNNPDYARKLFLIENCIYGVDIQQIAIQISKLRFFISLIVDQKVNDSKPNRNILSMPNLETKFVAANTLIALDKPQQMTLMAGDVERLEKELASIRHKIFFTRKYSAKKALKKKEKEKREELQTALTQSGFSKNVAGQIAGWNPFDPMQSAKFFDIETMFGFDGCFDVVIGNPPYIEFKKLPAEEKTKFSNYTSAKGKYDIYVIFDERANSLLKSDGMMCFIQPTTFMKKDFGESIRKFIKENFKIKTILDFADIQVFEGATNYTGVFLFSKSKLPKNYKFDCHQYLNTGKSISVVDFQCSLTDKTCSTIKNFLEVEEVELDKSEWNFQNDSTNNLLTKFSVNTKSLSEITESIFQGIASGKDEVFYVNENTVRDYKIEKGILKKLLKGKDIKKYVINWSGYYVIYPYDKNSRALSEATLKYEYPNAFKYLKDCKNVLKGRDYFDNSPKKWFELWNQRSFENFQLNRIITPEITDRNNFVLTNSFYGNTKTYHIIPKDKSPDHYLFLLGLLNSTLLDFIYKKITTPQAGGFYAYKTQFLSKLPIRAVKQHKPYSEIVSKILKAKDENPMADIKDLERQLDKMVYNLYELTEEEIKIIEGNV